VVVGLLLAFFALMLNMRLKPYSDGGLNFVSQVSQLNLLAFLFVALLLKVNLDGEGDNSFFSFIVGIKSIVRWAAFPYVAARALTVLLQVPIALPIFIRVWLRFYGGGLEAKMVRKLNAKRCRRNCFRSWGSSNVRRRCRLRRTPRGNNRRPSISSLIERQLLGWSVSITCA
jgi:hypothetical protein